jgi:NAD(P)-dependent dehydrogenase (short-subunit alcohol dehydrogenase family)
MGRVEGKVAFITGAARGQGRSHAIRLAQEGADIIAVDLCDQIATVEYPMATEADLAETVKEVEALDRRIVARQADVRDQAALQAAFDEGVAQLGGVDIVLANAGIAPMGAVAEDRVAAFRDVVDVNLSGGGLGYTAAKHGVVGLMRGFATNLAKHSIRVNSVHPTGVNTPMVVNEVMERFLREDPTMAGAITNMLPVDLVQPVDISNAILFLVSDEARYVTGVTFPVDAGFTAK